MRLAAGVGVADAPHALSTSTATTAISMPLTMLDYRHWGKVLGITLDQYSHLSPWMEDEAALAFEEAARPSGGQNGGQAGSSSVRLGWLNPSSNLLEVERKTGFEPATLSLAKCPRRFRHIVVLLRQQVRYPRLRPPSCYLAPAQ